MSKPLVLSISHSLGKEEAVRRLKSGLSSVPATFHHVLAVQEEVWTGDHLQFRVSALGQVASGTIDVADDHVRLTVALPWLLAQLAKKMQLACCRFRGHRVRCHDGTGGVSWRGGSLHANSSLRRCG
jgi:Putative polyhydroxyalkanoic acid system protein (PHA_gran_rgn)